VQAQFPLLGLKFRNTTGTHLMQGPITVFEGSSYAGDARIQDQSRLRANLKEMPPTARAYKRYLEKFDTQESQIEALQDRIKKLQALEAGRRKQLDDFLANFTVE
jgi:hypothetical protein